MRILLVILHAQRAKGGAEAYTLQLFHALREAGHDPMLASSSFDADFPVQSRVPLAHDGLTRSRRYASFLNALDAHLLTTDYDVIHAMLPVRRCDVYHPHAGIAARERGNLLNPRRRAFAAVERDLLTSKTPPVVLSLSSYIDAETRAAYPDRALRLERLMNAVDLRRFVPASATSTRNTSTRVESTRVESKRAESKRAESTRAIAHAVIVAQDFVRKGVPELLDAIRPLAITLTVVGACDQPTWEKKIARLGLTGRVRFVGVQSDVLPFYHDADFFVLPTRHDPCSLVVLEALACGLPVITTMQNGAADVMTHGTHGFVLDRRAPFFVNELTHALDRLADPRARAPMAEACRALRESLSYQHHFERLLSIYRSVAR